MYRHQQNRGFSIGESFVRMITSRLGKVSAALFLGAAVIGLCFAVPAHAVDKLIVKDGSNNEVFAVHEDGQVVVGDNTVSPLYPTLTKILIVGPANDTVLELSGDYASPNGGIADYTFLNRAASSGTTRLATIQALTDSSINTGQFRFLLKQNAGDSAPLPVMTIRASGNVGIGTTSPTHPLQLAGGAYSDGNAWYPASSRTLKENIKELGTTEAVNTLEGLDPVKFNYKNDKEQQHVGFIAEDVPDLVALKDRKALSPLDIVAVLTKVVQEQQKTIATLSAKVEQLNREVKLKNGFAAVEMK